MSKLFHGRFPRFPMMFQITLTGSSRFWAVPRTVLKVCPKDVPHKIWDERLRRTQRPRFVCWEAVTKTIFLLFSRFMRKVRFCCKFYSKTHKVFQFFETILTNTACGGRYYNKTVGTFPRFWKTNQYHFSQSLNGHKLCLKLHNFECIHCIYGLKSAFWRRLIKITRSNLLETRPFQRLLQFICGVLWDCRFYLPQNWRPQLT